MNHAAVSPLSSTVCNEIHRHLRVRNRGPFNLFEGSQQAIAECRGRIAGLIGAPSTDQIAFTRNTSDGLNIIAEGIRWNKGDEILLNNLEFPANIQPWRALERRGVTLRILKNRNGRIETEDLVKAITPSTRLLSISAVQYQTGHRADLKAIGQFCSEHNILFVVDAIQHLGAGAIDVQSARIDAVATGGHKWLMAPMGAGFLYLSDQLKDQFDPPRTGWLSVEDPLKMHLYEQPWLDTARRLETGTPGIIGIIGLNRSLKTLSNAGYLKIEQHISSLTRTLTETIESWNECRLATPLDPGQRGGIVTFTPPAGKEASSITAALQKQKIAISDREGMLRISPHFYNTPEEVETVLGSLKRELGIKE